MGAGIAAALRDAGIPVTLIERDDEALGRGLTDLRRGVDGAVNRGRLSEAAAVDRMAGVTASTNYAALAATDLVIEAVFEELSVKRAVFRRAGAPPAGWTRSSLPIPPISTPRAIAAGVCLQPQDASSACTSSARPT